MGIFHRMGVWDISARQEVPETWKIPKSWEIPGREKVEAIREVRNRNFPLNIPKMGRNSMKPRESWATEDQAGVTSIWYLGQVMMSPRTSGYLSKSCSTVQSR